MTYEYKTEGVFLEEKLVGRTTAASDATTSIADQFNRAAAEGWELINVVNVNVVGKLLKSSERRDIAVAIYRRPLPE